LQRTFDPGRLQPRDVLALQRTVGNQAVERLLARRAPVIQPKLTVGPVYDRYEEEADHIAGLLTHAPAPPAPPKVTRKENRDASPLWLEGGPLDASLASDITHARGGGHGLDTRVRRSFEARLGSDFQQVRVHTDNRADQLNRSLSARAFTTGQDIFFKRGEYRPHSGAGQQLLAHELTHVVQQVGAPKVQRWSWSWPWSKKKKDETGKQTDKQTDKQEDKNKKGATAFTKAPYNPLIATAMPGSTEAVDPKKLAQAQESAGSLGVAIPDYTNPDLGPAPADRYVVTIAVSQEKNDWWEKIKKLKTIGLKTLFKSPIELFSRIKSGDWEEYLLAKMLQTDDAKVLEQATNDFHSVGHTWIRLTAYASNKVKQHYSYGFWPRKIGDEGGYQMNKYVPGQVRHPDIVHEDDAIKRYYDKTVTGEQFQNALSLAQERYLSPPAYHVLDYNCTKFAREIVQAAGRSYPGSGIFPSIGYSPGQLFSALGDRLGKNKQGKTAYADDPLSDVTKSVKAGVEAREGLWKTKQKGLTPQDTNNYPQGIYEIPIPKDITLQASLTPEGPLTTKLDLKAADGDAEIYVKDELTTQYGRAYVKQSGKTYYFPIDQVLQPGMTPTGDLPEEPTGPVPPSQGTPYVATDELNISDQPPIANNQIFKDEAFYVIDSGYPGNVKDWAVDWVHIWWEGNEYYAIADDLRTKAKATATQNAPAPTTANDTSVSTTNVAPAKSIDLEKVLDPTALAFLSVGNWEGAAYDLGGDIFKLNEDELNALAEYMKITRKELDKQIAEYKKTYKPK
jgi:hypothetical protein